MTLLLINFRGAYLFSLDCSNEEVGLRLAEVFDVQN